MMKYPILFALLLMVGLLTVTLPEMASAKGLKRTILLAAVLSPRSAEKACPKEDQATLPPQRSLVEKEVLQRPAPGFKTSSLNQQNVTHKDILGHIRLMGGVLLMGILICVRRLYSR